jgi:hypothetical protein
VLQGIDTEPERPIPPNLCHLTIIYDGETNYTDVINSLHRRREHPETVELQSVHICTIGKILPVRMVYALSWASVANRWTGAPVVLTSTGVLDGLRRLQSQLQTERESAE